MAASARSMAARPKLRSRPGGSIPGHRRPVGGVDGGELESGLDHYPGGGGQGGDHENGAERVADHAGTPASSWAGTGAIGVAGSVSHS
jgi:hypothetical protein